MKSLRIICFIWIFTLFLERNFHVGKYLELEMEFRTSELSGILLSISEPTGFPALSLEIFNGNVSYFF